MKKMTQNEMMNANGGWGVFCPTCGWSRSYPWWAKGIARQQVFSHRSSHPGHYPYIC